MTKLKEYHEVMAAVALECGSPTEEELRLASEREGLCGRWDKAEENRLVFDPAGDGAASQCALAAFTRADYALRRFDREHPTIKALQQLIEDAGGLPGLP
jgi:hypothetical protein